MVLPATGGPTGTGGAQATAARIQGRRDPQHDGAPLEAVSEKAPAEVGLQPDGQPDVDEDETPQFVAPEARPPPWEEQDTPLFPPPRAHQSRLQGRDVLPTPVPTRGSLSPPRPGSNRTSPQAPAPPPPVLCDEQTREQQHISNRGPARPPKGIKDNSLPEVIRSIKDKASTAQPAGVGDLQVRRTRHRMNEMRRWLCYHVGVRRYDHTPLDPRRGSPQTQWIAPLLLHARDRPRRFGNQGLPW